MGMPRTLACVVIRLIAQLAVAVCLNRCNVLDCKVHKL